MAELLKIEAHGSIGVLLWAAANKLVKQPEAELHLTNLENSSLWLSPRVRAEAQIALEKIFSRV